MGFTPETITAPSVPDGLDPLNYLTAKEPQSKAQEAAQAEARQLAYGGGSTALAQSQVVTENTASVSRNQALDTEAKKTIQEAKTTRIPTKINRKRAAPVEYPYFFSVSKSRFVYHSMPTTQPEKPTNEERERSLLAGKKAPVYNLTYEEMVMGPQYIDKIHDKIEEFGMVKLVMPEEWTPQSIPFSSEHAIFKPFKQAVAPANQEVTSDLEQMTSGFVRAIIRFHTASPASERKVTKLPYYERRPIDLYRLFCTVMRRGGHDEVTKRKEWAQVGRDLGYSSVAGQTLSSNIRNTYTRVILPFKQWLTEQLGEEYPVSDPRIMPRIDVMDYRMSHMNMDNWKKLQFDIAIEKPHSVPLESRQFVDITEPETQIAYSFLKQFKQASSRCVPADQVPIEALESAYTKLPQYFVTESTPDIKLYPYPNDAAKLFQYGTSSRTGNDPLTASSSTWDPWDFTTIPYRNNELASLIQDNIDDICIPKLKAGGQFATTSPSKPPHHTYLLSTIVEGSGRTWYTQNDTWIDQQRREIVIVHPNTVFTNWCHGYSAEVSVNILNQENWIPWAIQNKEVNRTICIPRLVANIATCDRNVTAKLKTDALNALDYLSNRERVYMHSIKAPRFPIESPTGEESDTDKRADAGKETTSNGITGPETTGKTPTGETMGETSIGKATGLTATDKSTVVKLRSGQVTDKAMTGQATAGQATAGQASAAKATVVCSQSGEKLFFSWIIANDTIYSPAYFLENPVANASFFCRNQEYFNILKQKLDQKPVASNTEWLSKLQSELTDHTKFPSMNKIWKLVQSYPTQAEDATVAVATAMRQAIANSHKFINSDSKLDNLNLAEADNDHQTIQSHVEMIESTAERMESNWELLTTALSTGDIRKVDEVLNELHQSKHLITPRKREVVDRLRSVPSWVDDSIKATSTGSQNRALFLKNLKSAENLGHKLGLTYKTPLMNRIHHQIHAFTTGFDQMKALVTGPDILVPGVIQKLVAESRDWYTSQTEDIEYVQLVHQFKIVVFSLPLIERMYHPVITERPRRSEMAQLATLNNPSINTLLEHLQMWLDEATKLDWITIATQITRISQGGPPTPESLPATPISVTSIVELCRKLYTLLVVCDDIVNVQSTLVNALRVLNNVPLPMLAQYGFSP